MWTLGLILVSYWDVSMLSLTQKLISSSDTVNINVEVIDTNSIVLSDELVLHFKSITN